MKRNYQLALLSAFLLWFAWPPIPFSSAILLIALVPILIATQNIIQSEEKKKGKLIFRTTFLCFFAWNTASIYWVFNSLDSAMPTWIAALISLIPFGLGAFLMTLAFWLYYRMRLITSRVWAYCGLACFWIAYEYLHQSWDLAFPWMNLGNGFAATHQLVQWYEFTGVYGGTLWVLLSNILFFEIWLSFKAGTLKLNRTRLIIPTAILVIFPIAISLFIYFNHTEKLNPANIVVVQPNIDPYKKFGIKCSYFYCPTPISHTFLFAYRNFSWKYICSSAGIRGSIYFLKSRLYPTSFYWGHILIDWNCVNDKTKDYTRYFLRFFRMHVPSFFAIWHCHLGLYIFFIYFSVGFKVQISLQVNFFFACLISINDYL
jgi:hypothetical protein